MELAPSRAAQDFDARRFFAALRDLSPLRVISACGPSTFEAIIDFDAHGFDGRMMNAITPAYHWHFDVTRLRHLRSQDETHARSGRRVLFFELRQEAGQPPFMWIYVHRERGAEFDAERLDHRQQPVVPLPVDGAMVAGRCGIGAEDEPAGIDVMIAAELAHDAERRFDHVLFPANQRPGRKTQRLRQCILTHFRHATDRLYAAPRVDGSVIEAHPHEIYFT